MATQQSILIVEDEPVIADDIAMILERNDYIVSGIVESADDTINHLSREAPNLVLLDINIEGKNDGIWWRIKSIKIFKFRLSS